MCRIYACIVGAEQNVDSREPHDGCLECCRRRLVEVWKLEGNTCPVCAAGTFVQDPDSFAVS